MTPEATRVLKKAIPAAAQRAPGVFIGVLADISVVGLLGLSMWLIVRAAEQPPILWLTFAIVGVRALAIGRAAFRYVERLTTHDAAFYQLAQLRAQIFASLIPRMPGVIDTHRRGEVLSGFVDDVDQLQDESLRVRHPFTVSTVVTLLSIIVVALISPLAAMITLLCLVASVLLAVWASHAIASATDREVSARRAELADVLLERFESAHILVAFDALSAQRIKLSVAQQSLDDAQRRSVRATGLTQALMTFGSGLATVLILIIVSPALDAGLSAPLFAAVVIVPAAVAEVFGAAPTAIAARRRVTSSAERVAALAESRIPAEIPAEVENNPCLKPGVPGAPLISVRNFSVQHPGESSPGVDHINFDLHSGQTIVVSGESGAGKTTIAMGLLGFLAHHGEYQIQGRNASDFGTHQLREIVGLAQQEAFLFDANLRQNLKFADPEADDEKLLNILDRVGLHAWAHSRGGLDAQLGPRGALVSGGQAQRIALARVILADFRVVILDEPTAGVDRPLAQQLMLDLLSAVPKDKAVILITHADIPASIPAKLLRLPEPQQP